MPVIHENDVDVVQGPGRYLQWLLTKENLNANHLSCVLIHVPAGETVKPAHSHPVSEEAIYIIRGSGKVMIDDDVHEVKAGSLAFFPAQSIHMLRNTGDEEMKVICFYGPPTAYSEYQLYEDIEFRET